MHPDFCIDAVYARKEFADRKTELVDDILWMTSFVMKSEYVER